MCRGCRSLHSVVRRGTFSIVLAPFDVARMLSGCVLFDEATHYLLSVIELV